MAEGPGGSARAVVVGMSDDRRVREHHEDCFLLMNRPDRRRREEGTLTEEEAEKLGGRSIVLQAVGVEESLRVDTKHWPLLRGDVLLLCSDGLSGMVKDAPVKEILLAAGDDVGKAAENLVAEAN